ncbi:hypothetical protein IV203_009689 [Nitzschia inconspicua]|uniref:Uncharacterized protein n=1 Tax=Nitzschia inconspicua TaxID=303405 RepID=A0A9K3KUP8_9STRA|nr:hypothetical protein IV203_009689 [Nitzschia inconspicua]
MNRKEKRADQPIRINASTCYHHSNGILTVMANGQRMPAEMPRRLVRPLYPPGTSLDSKQLFNIPLKIKRMLAKGESQRAVPNISGLSPLHQQG